MERPKCENCPYWEDGEEVGVCHRRSPQWPVRISEETGVADLPDFPETTSADFCGEHPGFDEYIMEWRTKLNFENRRNQVLPAPGAKGEDF